MPPFRAYGVVGKLMGHDIMCVDLLMEVVFNMLSLLLLGRGDKKVICNKFIQTVQFRLVPGKLG